MAARRVPCIVMLILGVGFPHRARGDADLEHRILQKIVPLLTCVLALDPRFAQRLADVCGQLPKAVLDAAAPEPLKTLRAAVSNPRGADLSLLRRIVGRIPDVAPASRTAPGGVARGAPPARRQGTPRPRTMPIQTTAQLRQGGYLAPLVQEPPRVLDPNWPMRVRSLLREIHSSKGSQGRGTARTWRSCGRHSSGAGSAGRRRRGTILLAASTRRSAGRRVEACGLCYSSCGTSRAPSRTRKIPRRLTCSLRRRRRA